MSDDYTPITARDAPARLASIDAYRGFVMFLMMAEILHLGVVAGALPDNPTWRFLAHHQDHVEWTGCTLHDMIQPSFSFLVGVALPFSLASRRRRDEPLGWMILHAAWRAFLLCFLGIFLRSIGHTQTRYTFEDTLTQIGLGYFPLFLLGLAPVAVRWSALVLILVGYWGAFAAYPLPGPDFDLKAVMVQPDWAQAHNATGFAAHWNKNTNFAWAFDTWFLNLFPAKEPFTANGGGYSTLSFIPTLATMILGLLAGGWLRDPVSRGWRKVLLLVLAGAASLGLGILLDRLGVCPIVKRIWTPSWTLFSGGWCFLLMAGFYVFTDGIGYSGWSLPLRVIGANSIFAYCMAHLVIDFIESALHTHLGHEIFNAFGKEYEPLVMGASILLVEWLVLFWMYRRRIFLKI